MRINNINNIGFKAQYYQESPNTKKQIAKIFDDKIAEKTAEFQKQHEITKQEVDKLNKIKGELDRISENKKTTLAVIDYMRSENVQRTINQMPKYDKITLHTPDLDGDLTESGYLTYSEGKKPLFSREVRYLSESFPTCYFEDENSSFDKRFITQWFSVINGEF